MASSAALLRGASRLASRWAVAGAGASALGGPSQEPLRLAALLALLLPRDGAWCPDTGRAFLRRIYRPALEHLARYGAAGAEMRWNRVAVDVGGLAGLTADVLEECSVAGATASSEEPETVHVALAVTPGVQRSVPAAERPHADVLKVWVAFELVAVDSARLCSIESAVAWTVASLGELIGTQ
eukprot:gnl/TRDRNA2_/TRDRNA2_149907_c0_seq2.p1 gnl/TRDRNA2_/TRDRNA2_149907_c0~~gnl/TRDRNA2_/TRDRNA2_149907_c0_seq2.p1  ORF type:complete len:203 (+),score=16.79 gnl/TRDRNA2_/TRDRNA2_149907_c0_seq2:63-611(+)